MVNCKITSIKFAEKGSKKAFDFAAVVDCLAYDPDDPEYQKAGITRELVEARADRFANQHVTTNHISPDVDPGVYQGSSLGIVFDEDGKGYMSFGVASEEYAEYIKESGASVSLEWIIAKDEFGNTKDVTPSNITVCEPGIMNPRCKTAETLAVHAVAMGIYVEVTEPVYADPKNALFPCAYEYELRDSALLILKLQETHPDCYSADEWTKIKKRLVDRSAELGI
uniref:Uncharacterized protein n=1 Tax=Methanococcus maripaludis (strain C6 / ATCC BAA-1332) TaxID=444158 RepID=A9A7G5_METM6